MNHTEDIEMRRETVGRLLHRLAPLQACVVMLVLSAIGAFYATAVVAVLLGGAYTTLTNPLLLAIWSAVLIAANAVGMATKRVALVNGILALILISSMVYFALNGSGSVFVWVRSIAMQGLMPILNATCLLAIERSYLRASK